MCGGGGGVGVRWGDENVHWKDLLELCVEYSHVRCTLCGLHREVRTQGAVLLFYDRKKKFERRWLGRVLCVANSDWHEPKKKKTNKRSKFNGNLVLLFL